MNYWDFSNFKIIKITNYIQKIIMHLSQWLNIFWKRSGKTHQNSTMFEPNHTLTQTKPEEGQCLIKMDLFWDCLLNYKTHQGKYDFFEQH